MTYGWAVLAIQSGQDNNSQPGLSSRVTSSTLEITRSVHDGPEMQEAGHNCDKRRALLRLVILYPSKLIGCS